MNSGTLKDILFPFLKIVIDNTRNLDDGMGERLKAMVVNVLQAFPHRELSQAKFRSGYKYRMRCRRASRIFCLLSEQMEHYDQALSCKK